MSSESSSNSSPKCPKKRTKDNDRAFKCAAIKYKKRKAFTVRRDFPLGCGPSKGTSVEAFKKVGSSLDTESEEEVMILSGKNEGVELAMKAEKKHTHLPEGLDAECKKTIGMGIKANPCQRLYSANRSFPPGCGIKTSLAVDNKADSESTPSENNSSGSKTSACGSTLSRKDKEATKTDRNQMEVNSIACDKQHKNDTNKSLDRNLSVNDQGISLLQENISTVSELPEPRVIVHALVAMSNYPGRQNKRGGKVKGLRRETCKEALICTDR